MHLSQYSTEQPYVSHAYHLCFVLSNVYGNRLNGSIPAGFQKLESLTYLWVLTVVCLQLFHFTMHYYFILPDP